MHCTIGGAPDSHADGNSLFHQAKSIILNEAQDSLHSEESEPQIIHSPSSPDPTPSGMEVSKTSPFGPCMDDMYEDQPENRVLSALPTL